MVAAIEQLAKIQTLWNGYRSKKGVIDNSYTHFKNLQVHALLIRFQHFPSLEEINRQAARENKKRTNHMYAKKNVAECMWIILLSTLEQCTDLVGNHQYDNFSFYLFDTLISGRINSINKPKRCARNSIKPSPADIFINTHQSTKSTLGPWIRWLF